MPEKEPAEQSRIQHFDKPLANHVFYNAGRYGLAVLSALVVATAVWMGVARDSGEDGNADLSRPGLSVDEIETVIQNRRGTNAIWLAGSDIDATEILDGKTDDLLVETAEITAENCVSPSGTYTTPAKIVPVLLVRSASAQTEESYKFIYPTDEHKEVLEQKRQEYFVSLEKSAFDARPPKEIDPESRQKIAVKLSEAMCIGADYEPQNPRVTSQRTIVAESAGPVDSNEAGGSKALLYIVLGASALAVAKAKKWI